MGKALSPGESLARKLVGGLLWGVSAALSTNLFLSFSGGNLVKVIVLGAMAVGLEGAKILTWKSGGSQKILAWVLIGLSVLASFGAALQTVRSNDQVVSRVVTSTDALDHQIRDLEERISNLPPTWLTWYRNLSADLEKLRESRKTMESQESRDSSSPGSSMFQYLSDFFRWDQFWLELGVLMVMAVALEWGAISLLSDVKFQNHLACQNITLKTSVTAEQYLAKMVELGNRKYLGGRDRVGKSLGMDSYQSRKVFDELVKTGKIILQDGRSTLCKHIDI